MNDDECYKTGPGGLYCLSGRVADLPRVMLSDRAACLVDRGSCGCSKVSVATVIRKRAQDVVRACRCPMVHLEYRFSLLVRAWRSGLVLSQKMLDTDERRTNSSVRAKIRLEQSIALRSVR